MDVTTTVVEEGSVVKGKKACGKFKQWNTRVAEYFSNSCFFATKATKAKGPGTRGPKGLPFLN